MGQDQANQYCREQYNELVRTGEVEDGAWHVWAHLEEGKCVYNKGTARNFR
ncbi:MAG: hypothetical protein QNJ41_23700 [Xenococcaceae cyanobacterium MO_188.B32]|nr:hypothetical protein [Xenococcaceae cyanobacterium MO_188.B32]